MISITVIDSVTSIVATYTEISRLYNTYRKKIKARREKVKTFHYVQNSTDFYRTFQLLSQKS